MTTGQFIPHCDDPPCDLGVFEYDCPACNRGVTDYDVWWAKDEIYGGAKHPFECEKCGAKLVVKWHREEGEMEVSASLLTPLK